MILNILQPKKIFISVILFSVSLVTTNAAGITHSAWIPRWAPLSGEESVRRNNELFSEISPMWYKVNPDGSLYSYERTNEISLKKLLSKNNIELMPTVAMFDYQIISAVFSTQESFDRHIDAILNEVEDKGYAGIDLDYESTLESDKEKYFEFLEILSTKLKAKNKKLSVTVLAKWGDDINYSFPQTRNVQDWTRIGKYADEVRIMAYDYTYSGSVHPGPIGPLSWDDRILRYAITKLPKDKVVLGIPLYAYQWRRPATEDFFEKEIEVLIKERNFSNGSAFVNTGVKRLMNENEGEIEEYEGEKFFRYQKEQSDGSKEDVVLVFSDRKSVVLRQQLAEKYGIKGVT
ncbi:hypothetical protein KBD45_04345, partial [Candidatus Dojkabacteria bacterium]|nr:hypothetical protein [Candidatus Dojkabacteria bacterium]